MNTNDKVKFVYLQSGQTPATPDAGTVYFNPTTKDISVGDVSFKNQIEIFDMTMEIDNTDFSFKHLYWGAQSTQNEIIKDTTYFCKPIYDAINANKIVFIRLYLVHAGGYILMPMNAAVYYETVSVSNSCIDAEYNWGVPCKYSFRISIDNNKDSFITINVLN